MITIALCSLFQGSPTIIDSNIQQSRINRPIYLPLIQLTCRTIDRCTQLPLPLLHYVLIQLFQRYLRLLPIVQLTIFITADTPISPTLQNFVFNSSPYTKVGLSVGRLIYVVFRFKTPRRTVTILADSELCLYFRVVLR